MECLDVSALKGLVRGLLEETAALSEELASVKKENAELRDEVARLKGLKGRPKLKPSGMAKATGSGKAGGKKDGNKKKRRRGWRRSKPSIDEDRIVKACDVPPGSRFKGYEDRIIRDVVLRPWVIRLRRERWLTPDGRTIVAPYPAGIEGPFGAGVVRLVLGLYHRGQMTVDRVRGFLGDVGVEISERQVVRFLTEGKTDFFDEARDVLRAGLETARWITVDDTGARHRVRNGVCTQVGDDRFTWFETTFSKSRLNFLSVLRAGHEDYVIDDEALAYMRRRNLSEKVVAKLAGHPARRFANEAAWRAHLEALEINKLKVHPDPVKVATEGALWGSILAHGHLRDAVIVSDDAGQFNLGIHALCWVHAERLIHKLDAFCDWKRAAKERIRAWLWRLYADLKAYKEAPTAARRRRLERRFDRLFTTETGFATLDRLLSRLFANKSELLRVLERPDIPLHTNGSENDIRCQVTRSQISGGTRSDRGRDARDRFLSLMKTCDKLHVSFWDFLGDRLNVPGSPAVPWLPDLVR